MCGIAARAGAFAAAFLCAVSGPAAAAPRQEPASEPSLPVFRAAAELVQLDVVVTDTAGRPVRGLHREDFQLLEDGLLQPITHFAVGSAGRPAALPAPAPSAEGAAAPLGPGPAAAAAPAGRTIVFVFDDLHIGAGHLSAAKRDAVRFVKEQVAPGDRLALVTTSGVRGGAQPLTRDREAVIRAVERVTLQDRSARSRFARPYISEQQAEQISRFGELAGGGNDAFELAVAQFSEEYFLRTRDSAEAMVRERVQSILAEGERFTRASLSTVEATVRSLASVRGRKIVVLLTEGFYLGRATMYETAYDVRLIADAATRSGAVIYSIDVSGLTVPAPAGDVTERGPTDFVRRSRVDSGQDENRREGMRAVAEETGGLAVLDRNDVGKGLERVLADNELYYLLAYQPPPSRRPGRFRRVEVRLTGRRGLVVRTRRGYFEAKAEPDPAKAQRQQPGAARDRARDALTSIVPLDALPVRLAADFLDLPEAGPVVVVNVGIELDALRSRHASAAPGTSVEIVGVVTNGDGQTVEQIAARVPLDGAASAEPIDRGMSRVSRWLPLNPGLYQVRVAAIGPGADEVGSAFEWIEVPDLARRRLTLSSLFLSPARAAPADGAPAAEGDARVGGLAGGATPWRRFRVGDEIDAVLFAYNALADGDGRTDLTVRFRLLCEGRLVHEFLPRPMRPDGAMPPRRVPGGARLSLATLPAGEYQLRAVVDDRSAGTTAQTGASFTLE